jgi:hypothetical protein
VVLWVRRKRGLRTETSKRDDTSILELRCALVDLEGRGRIGWEGESYMVRWVMFVWTGGPKAGVEPRFGD